jgi:type IV pilus assembly protein PilN
MPRVNLLPWREERRKQRQREFYLLLGAAGVAAALLVGAGEVVLGRIQARQVERNDFIQREIAVLDRKIAEIRNLQAEKAALIARMEVIQELQVMRPQAVKLLDGLARATPDGAMLSRFAQSGTNVSLDGVAQSNARVSTFMHNLDDSDRFAEPTLNVIRAGERNALPVSNFSLTVPLEARPADAAEAAP